MTDDGAKARPGLKLLGPNRWEIRAQARDPRTGRKIGRSAIFEGTKRAALRRQAEIHAELRAEGSRQRRIQMRAFARTWLASRAVGDRPLKPSVVTKYGSNLDHMILPAIGDLYVDAIVPSDIRNLIVKLGQDYAENTVLNVLKLLRTMAKDALAEGLTTRDFCARVTAPTPEGYTDEDPNLLTAAELGRLFTAIPRRWLALFILLAYTGMRWGEVSGLKWEDVNTDEGEIKIKRNNWRGIEVAPKTSRSKRPVPLPREVVELLGAQPRGLVFPTEKGKRKGLARRSNPMRQVLDKACAAASVTRITTHGLRRTFNNLSRTVADRLVVMSIVGHATEQMHSHYSHISLEEKTAAQDAVRRLVEKNPTAAPAPRVVRVCVGGCTTVLDEGWAWCPICGESNPR
ncbi:MAG: site-specific integrase [Actinomycetota bacterium]|nr:site-specific integrase [Actinomycetota bacterium]